MECASCGADAPERSVRLPGACVDLFEFPEDNPPRPAGQIDGDIEVPLCSGCWDEAVKAGADGRSPVGGWMLDACEVGVGEGGVTDMGERYLEVRKPVTKRDRFGMDVADEAYERAAIVSAAIDAART
jgi:hypothetical protein